MHAHDTFAGSVGLLLLTLCGCSTQSDAMSSRRAQLVPTGAQHDAVLDAAAGDSALATAKADAGCSDTLRQGEDSGPPSFCPMRASPTASCADNTAPAGSFPDHLTIKFVEGSHVRLVAGRWVIEPAKMKAGDPALLHCVKLDVPSAICSLAAVNAALAADPAVQVEPTFTAQPEASYDAQYSPSTGTYLNDLNLYYEILLPAEHAPRLYEVLCASKVVDTVYYAPIPADP